MGVQGEPKSSIALHFTFDLLGKEHKAPNQTCANGRVKMIEYRNSAESPAYSQVIHAS